RLSNSFAPFFVIGQAERRSSTAVGEGLSIARLQVATELSLFLGARLKQFHDGFSVVAHHGTADALHRLFQR
ncbi:MAG: hypothetical protein AAFV29_21335, partial [Myxococcota bacterium]